MDCEFKTECTKGERRSIQINEKLENYKTKAREMLNSERGIELRKKRGSDVETPFGNIKHNHKFKRFQLRGKNKVNIEMGLMAIGHNIKKIAKKIMEELEENMLLNEIPILT